MYILPFRKSLKYLQVELKELFVLSPFCEDDQDIYRPTDFKRFRYLFFRKCVQLREFFFKFGFFLLYFHLLCFI